KSLGHQRAHVRAARPLVRLQACRKRSFLAGSAPCCNLPSGVPAPRSAPEGRGLERLADGDEVFGHRASEEGGRVGSAADENCHPERSEGSPPAPPASA